MNSKLTNKYGCWIAGGNIFDHKVEALRYANLINSGSVRYYFHDHVWENFDRGLLGKVPLTQLYKERALQLRDKYDYLILQYSGGSDSHNILYTFLKNKIKLDEITVAWPKPLIDGKMYTPNKEDKSARNAVSEWDFAIKPTLKYLAQKHPEIKINIVDYASNLSDRITSVEHIIDTMMETNILRGQLASTAKYVDPDMESKLTLASSTKKIGHIYGFEKPVLAVQGNNIYAQFIDVMFETSSLARGREAGIVEPFYWTADLPLLPMEQAYQCALYFKVNMQSRNLLYELGPIRESDMQAHLKYQEQGNATKQILYKESWDFNKFQADKPNLDRTDWFFWLYENQELVILRDNWRKAMSIVTQDLDSKMLIKAPSVTMISPIKTKPFFILSLDD